jgi:hypothetical protein
MSIYEKHLKSYSKFARYLFVYEKSFFGQYT